MNYDDLEKINELREKGVLSEEEFQKEKAKMLAQSANSTQNKKVLQKTGNSKGMDTNQYCMLLHLSQFAGLILPLLGLITPIVMWAVKKDDDPIIDAHGKIVVNWVISLFIYVILAFILMFVVIGFFVLILLILLSVIFPIIGAVKANDGELWNYPLSIPFMAVPDLKNKI